MFGVNEIGALIVQLLPIVGILVLLMIIFFVAKKLKRRILPQNMVINVSQNNELQKREGFGDISDQIRKLGELRAQGLLSEEEFQRKKSELLSRL